MLVTDAWAHCGNRKFRPIADVLQFMDSVGIASAVLVQPLGDSDPAYLAQVGRLHHDRVRIVGFVDFDQPAVDRELGRLVDGGYSGVRVRADILAASPDLAAQASRLGLIVAVHAPDGVAKLVTTMPEIQATASATILITHLGMPACSGDVMTRGNELLQLAAWPKVYVTLSGMHMSCPYPYRPIHGFMKGVVEAFGAARVMWGSNYPLSGDEGPVRDLNLVRALDLGLGEIDVSRVLHGSAQRIWLALAGRRGGADIRPRASDLWESAPRLLSSVDRTSRHGRQRS